MTEKQWKTIKYFKQHEFDSPDMPGSGCKMSYRFVKKLDKARAILGEPIVTQPPRGSAYRTTAWNYKVGGRPSSAHLDGCAVDIPVKDSRYAGALIVALVKAGFDRFGIGRTYIHVDDHPDKLHPCRWVY